MYNLFLLFFKYFNIFIIFKFLVKILLELKPFLFNKNNKFKFLNKYGKNSYVLITGSSEGIGFGYVKVFAELGFNLILTGLFIKELEIAKNNILKNLNNKIDIKLIEINFSHFENLEKIKKFTNELNSLDISILINNVGISNKKEYEKNKYNELIDMNNINCLTMTYLLRNFIPKFLKRNKKCAIINLSSLASKIIATFSSTYPSCKLFNYYILESLNNNNKLNNNIDILVVRPGIVKTLSAKKYIKNWKI